MIVLVIASLALDQASAPAAVCPESDPDCDLVELYRGWRELDPKPPQDGNPYREYVTPEAEPETWTPGPHVLVIINQGETVARMAYRSGPLCQAARDAVRRQVAPPPNTATIIYGRPSTTAFCVPQ